MKQEFTIVKWFQESVFNGLLDTELTLYSDEVWFTLSGYVNSQNSKYWSIGNPHAAHKVPLHDLRVGVWCAVSAQRINGPIFH
jgi:hypothetical protein